MVRMLVLLVGRRSVPYLEHVVQNAHDTDRDVDVGPRRNRRIEELPMVLTIADGEEQRFTLEREIETDFISSSDDINGVNSGKRFSL